jgi:sortase A
MTDTTTLAPSPVAGEARPRQAEPKDSGAQPAAVEDGGSRIHPVRVAGRILMIVGLIAALFIVYELTITGLVEQGAQAGLLKQFQQAVPTTTLDAPSSSPAEGSPVALLIIPSIDVSQVVIQGTTPSDLKSGPGHLMNTPLPGEAGNVVIVGRRTTYGGPFARLDELTKGDVIRVATGRGAVVYVVSAVEHISPGGADPVLDTPDNRLTLVTSDPAFIASGRLMVRAELQNLPLDISRRRPVLVGTADLGLAGDPMGLALGLIWGELLALVLWFAWHSRHRWSPEVLYLLTAPTALILMLLTFSSFDLLLPGTL